MGMTLKALRINAQLDQKTAAKSIGVTPETLGNWENARSFPNVKQINAIEKLYGVGYSDINFLLEDIGKTEVEEGRA
jgi:transcriptional regulator with XRE-family HTH domain